MQQSQHALSALLPQEQSHAILIDALLLQHRYADLLGGDITAHFPQLHRAERPEQGLQRLINDLHRQQRPIHPNEVLKQIVPLNHEQLSGETQGLQLSGGRWDGRCQLLQLIQQVNAGRPLACLKLPRLYLIRQLRYSFCS